MDITSFIFAASQLQRDEHIFDQLGVYWPKFIAQVINFLIVLFVLYRFAYQPILKLLEQRREKIREALANAEKVKKELAEAEKSRKEILREANQKASSLITEAQETGQAQMEKKIQEAVHEAEHIVEKARQAGKLEVEKMKEQARAELSQLVILTTSRVTGKVLTDEDQKRLQEETKAMAMAN